MAVCPSCNALLPEERLRTGARCPTCFDPLYETPDRFARAKRDEQPACAVHPDMGAVGDCARCRQFVCETCRTRWRGAILCAGCVDRALMDPAEPGVQLEPFVMAKRALYLAAGVWVVALASLIAFVRQDVTAGPSAVAVSFALVSAIIAGVPVAAVAMGFAASALRLPGGQRKQALTAFVVAGAYPAVVLGVGALTLWHS